MFTRRFESGSERRGWVLYLEGSTDLAILAALADKTNHAARHGLERPFVIYVANDPAKVQRHFYALSEAKPDIVGVALFDRLDRTPRDLGPEAMMWSKREIENYFTRRKVLEEWARGRSAEDLFAEARIRHMREAIDRIEAAQRELGVDIWSPDAKATDDALDPIFRRYFELTGQQLLFRKADYHELVHFVPRPEIDPEVIEKLNRIDAVAQRARPRWD